MTSLYEDLKWRGLIDNISHDELIEKLNNESLKFYAGYDPTSASLQIGNLLVVITQIRLFIHGHKPFIVMGGATGMIGDPKANGAERNLLDSDTIKSNIEGQFKQLNYLFSKFSKDKNAVFLNNLDWMKNFSYIDFLRNIGKRFPLSDMIAKDSVKSRLSSKNGISYTEFSYQILQSYDFAHLNKEFEVSLQIGGSDQWGNITAGIDLTRRLNKAKVHGLVMPLVTDSSGNKFGKSEGGETIYLDPSITSPYKMYQFLLNSDDSIVISYLKFFTFLSKEEILKLAESVQNEPHLREAQKELAALVVELVHGEQGLESALKATSFFFGGVIENVTDDEINNIFEDIPSVEINEYEIGNIDILTLLSMTTLFKSKGEAKRSIKQNGVSLNNIKVNNDELIIKEENLASKSSLIIRKGKKNYCVVKFTKDNNE